MGRHSALLTRRSCCRLSLAPPLPQDPSHYATPRPRRRTSSRGIRKELSCAALDVDIAKSLFVERSRIILRLIDPVIDGHDE